MAKRQILQMFNWLQTRLMSGLFSFGGLLASKEKGIMQNRKKCAPSIASVSMHKNIFSITTHNAGAT